MLMKNLFLVCLVLATLGVVRGQFYRRNHYPNSFDYNEFDYNEFDYNEFDYNEFDHGVDIKEIKSQNIPSVISTPEECARDCDKDKTVRNCHYTFTLEYYTTMGRACNMCKSDSSDQLRNVPQCQCIEADGFERGMLSINRMLPGPSIQVCQNDKIIVDVANHVEGMEASLHWHGIWQQGSQFYDGVPFLTQCPIPSGTTFRYQFVASNPGTHFYHSHAGLQKIDGQYGSLIVRQPRRVDPHGNVYDHDLPAHVIVLSDWMHEMSIERFPGRLRNKPGQLPENVLINGRGSWKNPTTNQTTNVRLESFVVEAGNKYRFRMVNSFSTVCPAQMTIQGHSIELIAQDGESVSATPVNTIVSASGERADFILHANQPPGAYWIQVQAVGPCADSNIRQFAILRYNGAHTSRMPQPSQDKLNLNPGTIYNHPESTCSGNEPDRLCASQLKPKKPPPKELLKKVPDHRIILPYKFFSYENSMEELFEPGSYPRFMVASDGDHINSVIDEISFAFPRVPPLSQPNEMNFAHTCNRTRQPANCKPPCQCTHTHEIKKGAIVEVIVYNEMSGPRLAHPFHLHGYAFHIFKMGQVPNDGRGMKMGISKAIAEHEARNYVMPPAKDTVVIPDGRYVIFRFKADNPGWWLFHCHFLYHTMIGMGLVFHVGEVHDLPPVPPMFPTCSSFTPEIA